MDYYSGQLLSYLIHGGILLLSLIILINKLWKRQTVIGAGEQSAATAPPDLVLSADHGTPSSSTDGRSYEVFLSFRGLDTRYNFTDHLYTALMDAGIHTFRDDNEIRMGEDLGSELLTAIEQSRISIPVFSTNYADSKWCLIELTKMVECRKNLNQIVLPVFYDVEPSDVRYQRGTYAKAFRKHQMRVDKKIVEEWKKALQVVGSLKGHNVKNRHEAELIKLVVTMVLSKLKKTSLATADYLVGIPHHVKEMLKLLDVSSMEVRIVGIHGMGGIGKTTVAKAVCNEISCHFENWIFLEDVRDTCQRHKGGLVQLQKQLISKILKLKDVDFISVDEGVNMIKERCCNKKVLIVLDDVDNLDQLSKLANKRDWYGLGSRIIITTRDRHILNKHGVDEVYEPGELDHSQSLKLFSMHAFRRDQPLNDYYSLSSAIARTAGGLPLALEVIGSHLFGKQKPVWEDVLKKLEKISHDEVHKKLRISYEELDYGQKQIFLDIACFFIGMDRKIATYIWNDSEYFPRDGIDILLLRSLVKIGDNDELRMHSQLRDLGREIVRSENFEEARKRSRLWFHDDALDVLKSHTGSQKVQGLSLDFGNKLEENCLEEEEFAALSTQRNGSEENYLRSEEFTTLSRLRLLQIDYAIIAGDFKHLLSKLRWLSWKGCPYNFTATNFHPKNLIVLDLSWSKITEDWEGWNQIKMAKKLKVINLSGCCDLIKTPDFSAFQSLEGLILEDCQSLVQIDTSIVHLKCLVFLTLKGCNSLVDLPMNICELNSLESLILSGCTKLSRLPMGSGSLKALRELRVDETSMEQLSDSIALPQKLEILSARNCGFFTVLPPSIGQLRFLTELAFDGTQIVMLPDSIGSLLKLRHLSLRHCRSLRKIPDSIGQLESLVEFDLFEAGVREIPDSIGKLKSLTTFILVGTQIVELPDSIGLLVKLAKLLLRDCKSLRKIPNSIGRLESLYRLDLTGTGIVEIPDAIGELKSLTYLQLGFTKIIELPDSTGLLSMLQDLLLEECGSLRRIPNSIGKLESLHRLCLTGTGIIEIPDAIGELKSLRVLRLGRTRIIKLPDSIGSLPLLEDLSLNKCGSLRRIPDSIRSLESLCVLDLTGAGIMEIPDAIGELKSLRYLRLGSTQIIELPDSIGSLSMLQDLSLHKCRSLTRIPDSIGRLESLCMLDLTKTRITEIPDTIGELKSLTNLGLGSTKINELPNSIGLLTMLQILSFEACGSLGRIPDSIGRLESLHTLSLDGTKITELPNSIQSLSNLRSLSLMHCRLLQTIPDSIETLESLHELRLDTTSIMDMPSAMGSQSNLKDIRITNLCIAGGKIPIDIGKLSSLGRLTLWSKRSFSLPESISSLHLLDLLNIKNCSNYPSLPDLPSRLSNLNISRCAMKTFPNLSNLTNLEGLTIGDCDNLSEIPSDIAKLSKLVALKLYCLHFRTLPASLSTLSSLERLNIHGCRNLQYLPPFPSGLKRLCLSSCMSVRSLPDLSNLKRIWQLQLNDFFKQTEIQGLERLESLKFLDLSDCRSIERLPNMSIMKRLQILILRNCEKLCDIDGLEGSRSLKSLELSGCISLERQPNLSDLKNLDELCINNCKRHHRCVCTNRWQDCWNCPLS